MISDTSSYRPQVISERHINRGFSRDASALPPEYRALWRATQKTPCLGAGVEFLLGRRTKFKNEKPVCERTYQYLFGFQVIGESGGIFAKHVQAYARTQDYIEDTPRLCRDVAEIFRDDLRRKVLGIEFCILENGIAVIDPEYEGVPSTGQSAECNKSLRFCPQETLYCEEVPEDELRVFQETTGIRVATDEERKRFFRETNKVLEEPASAC